jgi:hypothetical protein
LPQNPAIGGPSLRPLGMFALSIVERAHGKPCALRNATSSGLVKNSGWEETAGIVISFDVVTNHFDVAEMHRIAEAVLSEKIRGINFDRNL